jgi:tRNA 2-thiouridine synthesizing protein A
VEKSPFDDIFPKESSMADVILDARGLSCPLPVLKARKALRELTAGATIEVLSTDPGSVDDFPVFCRSAGHMLLDTRKEGNAFCFVIKKGAD